MPVQTVEMTELELDERVYCPADMKVVNGQILSLMTAAGYCEIDLFGMQMALEEAVVNGLKHGNGGDPSKAVHIRYQVTPIQTVVEIEDEGPGFDPASVSDPRAEENLERSSGRGLFLIRHYTTSVQFNDRGNRITLLKKKLPADFFSTVLE